MLLFFFTIFPISLMPGINMTYALNLGIARGYLKALPALLAQVLGVTLVALACIFGVATFLARGNFKLQKQKRSENIFLQGFVVAVSNPKAWIFFTALFPPFLDADNLFGARTFALVATLCVSESICLSIYALGGAVLKNLLKTHLKYLEIFCSVLMCAIGLWMILG
nr:LysE family transporter [uncultured Campylobacter sp.]